MKTSCAVSPMLPPGERLVTVRTLVNRSGVSVMVALPPASAGTVASASPLSWYM